jgi:putative hemolysin
MIYVEILIVAGLVVLNGLLAMSELAVVSSRPGRLKAMMERGVAGAHAALDLTRDPGRFLSTVQVGITLVGIVAGAYSGASLGARLSQALSDLGLDTDWAEPLGFTAVVAAITYVSLVIGELVPKQLALRNPEAIACRVAVPMQWLSLVARPFVFLLNGSGRLLIRLIGGGAAAEAAVTDEEIHALIAEAESAGVIESGERDLIAGVMRLGDRPVRSLMTPLPDVDMVGVGDDLQTLRRKLSDSVHSRLVVHGESTEDLIGIVRAKDVADALLARRKLDVKKLVLKVPSIPESMPALEAIELFRDSAIHVAFIQDEYGRVLGILTPTDLIETIAGTFATEEDGEPGAVQRDDGSWLLSGNLRADQLEGILGIRLPEKRAYETIAGLILESLKHMPGLGESVIVDRWRFEIVDLDGRRIDKVVASSVLALHRPGSRKTVGRG